MTSFIIVCAAMLLAAMALVAFPLMRTVPTHVKGQPEAPRANLTALTLVVVLPLAAAVVYAGLSNYPWKNPQAITASENPHGDGSAAQMADITRQLEARLKDNPNDAEGWRMLGRTYLVTGDPAKAVTAYEKAEQILGENKDAGLEVDIAEALVLTNDPAVQDRAKQIVESVLAADATNQKALWYSGVMAYKADDKETAKRQWMKLLELNPPEEIRQVLVTQLTALGAELPASLAAPPAAAGPAMGGGPMMAAEGPAPEPQGRTVRVAVTVDPSLADKIKPGVPLFVAARQPGIPGPPLAAVRLSTDALPATVVLSDANAMIEGRNLSSVDDVEIVARVAFGGTATTASGDLVGTAIHKKGDGPDLKVVIAKVQP